MRVHALPCHLIAPVSVSMQARAPFLKEEKKVLQQQQHSLYISKEWGYLGPKLKASCTMHVPDCTHAPRTT